MGVVDAGNDGSAYAPVRQRARARVAGLMVKRGLPPRFGLWWPFEALERHMPLPLRTLEGREKRLRLLRALSRVIEVHMTTSVKGPPTYAVVEYASSFNISSGAHWCWVVSLHLRGVQQSDM